jgi:hypothetical protein
MPFSNNIEKLAKFKLCEKYKTFAEAMPGIQFEAKDQQEIIECILNDCCKALMQLLEQNNACSQNSLKEVISTAMNAIEESKAGTFNKDFGYELCWYLSDVVGLKYKINSERKPWGYWKVAQKEVVIFNKKKAAQTPKKQQNSKASASKKMEIF